MAKMPPLGIILRYRMWWRPRTAMTPALTKKAPHPDQQVHRIPRARTRKQHRNRVKIGPRQEYFAVTVEVMRRPKEAAAVARTIKVTAQWIDRTIRRHRCNRAVQHPLQRPTMVMLELEAIATVVPTKTKTAVPQALLVPTRRILNLKQVQALVPIPKALQSLPALPQLPQILVVAVTPLATLARTPPRVISPATQPQAQLLKQPFIPGNGRSKPARINR